MADHGSRDHATWSASATERNWNCPGALALTANLPEDTNEAADWGTCAHQVAEKVLRGKGPADRYIGTTEKGKKFSFEVDEEMAETAQTYCNYVVSRLDSDPDAILQVEQHFSLAKLKPPFDAGGTADAVLYFPKLKLLEVVDLKGGRGVVVEAKDNKQGRTYGLGAVLANPGLDVDRVKVTIVQPRAPHKDGRIRSDEFHIADLLEWTTDLLAAMNASKEAAQDFDMGGMTQADWSRAYLKAGDHCDKTFCKARGFCPALKQSVEDKVGLWFDDSNQPHLANIPDADDPARLARDLDAIDMIEAWCNSRREHAHRLAEGGVSIADPVSGSTYILVAKQGREKWKEGTDDQVLAAVKEAGLAQSRYLNPGKLKTPKQIRKELGAKAGLVADLSIIPDAGTNLVRADKTTRDAVPGTASRYFEPSTD